jgi:hypothetical protein
MLACRLAHTSTSALGRPPAAEALNSAHARTAAALHCTEVCWAQLEKFDEFNRLAVSFLEGEEP